MTTRILITGATGFVGRELVAHALANQMQVRAVSRKKRTSTDPQLEYRQVGDLSVETDWADTLQEIDVVVHCAARVHLLNDRSTAPLADFRAANFAATLSLARQAATAGVRRLVFISSIGVNGSRTSGQPFTELDPPAPHSPYAVSKHEAELALMALAKATQLEVVIIRPPLIYGPDAPGNFGKLMRAVVAGRRLPLGAINNHRSFIGIDNFADFVLTCVVNPRAANQTFLVSDDCDLSTSELLCMLAQAAEAPSRLIGVPVWLLKIAGAISGRRDTILSLTGDLRVDISKARKVLGWTPLFSPKEGVRRIFSGENKS